MPWEEEGVHGGGRACVPWEEEGVHVHALLQWPGTMLPISVIPISMTCHALPVPMLYTCPSMAQAPTLAPPAPPLSPGPAASTFHPPP